MVRVVLDAERGEDRAERDPGETDEPEHDARPGDDEPEPGSERQRERDRGLRIELQRARDTDAAAAQVPLDVPAGLTCEGATLIE